MKSLEVPQALKIEHEEFREQLDKAVAAGGRTGDAALGVLKVLRPHILLEQEFAMPPLTLLPEIAADRITPEMGRILSKTDILKEELPRMLDEHKLIVAELTKLMRAATEENQYGFAKFAQKLILHAQTEEEILYPAAILVGEYLKLRLKRS